MAEEEVRLMEMAMNSKQCNKCGEVKSLSLFHKQAKGKLGAARNCKSCVNAYYQKNKEKFKERARLVYQANKDRHLKVKKRWRAANKDKVRAMNARRLADQSERTAPWANEQLIAAYYKEAKRLEELTGIKFHVDHIIPLRGELVSGLHVETNLQLLPAHENLGKSNSFDPQTFCA
jgi:hypothetical protein